MAKKDILVSLDLNKNEILNTKLQNLASPPALTASDKGFMYWDTVDNLAKFWTGSAWINGGGTVTPSNLNTTLSATQLVVTNTNGTGFTIPAADTINAGLLTKAQFDKLAGIATGANVTDSTSVNAAGAVMESDFDAYTVLVANVDNTPTPLTVTTNSVLGRIAGNIQAITIDNDLSSVSASDDTLASAKATKAYVDASIVGSLVYQGGYDASTNTPNLDSTPTGIKKGFTYTVTVAGNFFSTLVSVGDMVIAEKDNPTVEADYTVVNKDIPDIVDSSTSAKGLIQLATSAEVTTGSDALKAITPATLTSITRLGTIATGTWQGTIIGSAYGGTGVNNAGRTLTINNNNAIVSFTNPATTLTVANTASVSGTNTGDQTTISGNAGTATTLQTARNITLSGDISGTASFNGSADASITATLPNVATAGTYKSVTVNAKGLVTSGTNPTTLAGYGITDAAKKYAVDITGTGAATSFTVTHNLGTTDIVTFIKEATTLAKVEVEEVVTNTNTLTINFNTAPANGKVYRVTVIG